MKHFVGNNKLLSKSLPKNSIPLVIAGLCILSFGLLTPFLSFFQDDWPILYYQQAGAWEGLWNLHLYQSRPFGAFVYNFLFNIFGTHYLSWHIISLSLRILTALAVWKTIQQLWPHHSRIAFFTAAIFGIYPLFKLQPLSVTYALHWFAFLVYVTSLWTMVIAIKTKQRFWIFFPVSIFLGGLHLLTIEYYAGIELIRPLIIWLAVSPYQENFRKKIQTILKYWTPYFLLIVLFGFYRLYWIPKPYAGFDQNRPRMIHDFLNNPINTALAAVQFGLRDTAHTLVVVWGDVFGPKLFTLSTAFSIGILGFSFLVVGVIYAIFNRLDFPETGKSNNYRHELKQMLLAGITLTVLGPLPAWVTYQSITGNNPLWSNRFGLPAMLGASLVLVSLISLLIERKSSQYIVLSILIGVTVGWHISIENDYRWSTTKQSRFYYQLYWRAPFITPGTAILSDQEILPYMGEYPTSFALGLLYPPQSFTPQSMNYWYLSLNNNFENEIDDLVSGKTIESKIYSAQFSGESQNSLVIYYAPEKDQCLWVLSPEDRQIRVLPEIIQNSVPISNLQRIDIDPSKTRKPDRNIFGPELEKSWCYYYQTADLAKQLGNWENIVALWSEADKNGYKPGNGVEYGPFIEGFAYTGDWETAADMTIKANKITHVMGPYLCEKWERIENTTESSPVRNSTILNLREKLGCAP